MERKVCPAPPSWSHRSKEGREFQRRHVWDTGTQWSANEQYAKNGDTYLLADSEVHVTWWSRGERGCDWGGRRKVQNDRKRPLSAPCFVWRKREWAHTFLPRILNFVLTFYCINFTLKTQYVQQARRWSKELRLVKCLYCLYYCFLIFIFFSSLIEIAVEKLHFSNFRDLSIFDITHKTIYIWLECACNQTIILKDINSTQGAKSLHSLNLPCFWHTNHQSRASSLPCPRATSQHSTLISFFPEVWLEQFKKA